MATPIKKVYYLFFYLFLLFDGIYGRTKNDFGDDIKSSKVTATFTVQSIKINSDGLLNWTTKEEQGSLPYIIEQFVIGEWIKVSEINGIGSPSPNSYSVLTMLNSGENKFRIHQKGYDNKSRYSNTISYFSEKKPVTYTIANKNQTLIFSSQTFFIIYNLNGSIVKQGLENSVDISSFQKGYYSIVYDNKLGGFEKKKVLFKNTFFAIVIKPRRILSTSTSTSLISSMK
ncbi:MAG: hypothetical protein ABI315_04525 [Bacteroidia bacterium]